MMGKRIGYIDKLKGFAIILVVMGHVLEKGLGITDTYANVLYSSFHMPLFMYLSGLFAIKSFREWNSKECLSFLHKKALRIILPFIVVGGGWSLIMYGNVTWVFLGRGVSSFWFLPALFYCMILAMIVSLIENKLFSFVKCQMLFDVFLHLLFWFVLYLFYITLHVTIPYFLSFLKLYLFFAFGILSTKYPNVMMYIKNSQILYSSSIVLFIFSLLLQHVYKIPILLTGFFAIVVLINVFCFYDEKLPLKLEFIGRSSLQIYVFHWFLIPSFLFARHFQINIVNSEIINNMNLVPLLCLALCLTIPVIWFCLLVDLLIQRSDILKKIIFGG